MYTRICIHMYIDLYVYIYIYIYILSYESYILTYVEIGSEARARSHSDRPGCRATTRVELSVSERGKWGQH